MSTTMHAHIEVKRGNAWLHFAAPTVEPNYDLFEAMGGGRQYGNVKNLAVMGLPDNISEVTRFCYGQDKENMHLHRAGWIDTEAMCFITRNIADIEETFHTYINGNAIVSHDGWDDVRIVFWYDH